MKSLKSIRRETQARYRKNIAKLQKAGLLGKVNLRLAHDPKARRAIIKYQSYLSGKSAAVKAPSGDVARKLSTDLSLKRRGNVLLVPKERHETKFRVTKSGELKSSRPNPAAPGEKITRSIGKRNRPPKEGERTYYTIRERRRGLGTIKRTTFAKFDDLLEYLNAYNLNFDDIEQYIETETISEHGRKARGYDKTIRKERSEGHKRWARRRKRKAAKSSREKKRGGNRRL